MGKPFGLLHRIFSFSRGPKRSGSNFDFLNTNEHGQDPDTQDPDETLHQTGSIRTAGGIGGLGRGITNAASEISRSNTAATNNKGGENGLRKRLLRRASLSASDLLSWGHEKSTKRVASKDAQNGFGPPVASPRNNKAREISKQPLRTGLEGTHEAHHEIPELGLKNNISHYNNRVVEGLALGNGSSKRGKRDDRYLKSKENEDLTRLLRTSSANYRVISETDYRDMDPLEHPINAIALNRSTSIPLLSTADRSAPPTAWPVNLPVNDVAFPSPLVPVTLSHVPSVSSATSASTYKVTVHRRRIHSRTSFPEANRALDHLHSSSPGIASSTPSVSPRSSSELPEITPSEFTRKAISVKPSAIPKMHGQTRGSHPPDAPSYLRQSLNGRKELPPSMLPRICSQRQSTAQKPIHEKNTAHQSLVVNSQLYPVAPLRTVPPTSHRSTSGPLGRDYSKDNREQNQTDKPSIKLLYSKGDKSSRTSTMEGAFRYKTPLKGSDHFLANEEAYDGMVEKTDPMSLDQHTSPTPSNLTKSSVQKTPVKNRNVLKKKRRESQVSLVQGNEDISERASIKSQKSMGHESKSDKNGSRSNLRTVLGVVHAVEGVIERLHASAVGEQMLASPRRQRAQERAAEWDIVSVDEMPPTPAFESSQVHSLPVRHKSYSSGHYDGRTAYNLSNPKPVTPSKRHPVLLNTPRDQGRLARLRRDPSVVSLLDMYQADGTLKKHAFSNTPPAKPLQRNISERGFKSAQRVGNPREVKTNKRNGACDVESESRSVQMRRVYVEALDGSSDDYSLIPRLNSAKHVKSPATVTNIANPPTSVTLLNESSNAGEERVPSVTGIGKRSKVTVSEPRFGGAAGLHFPVSNSRQDLASFSSDNEESSRAIDISLFVEPGSIRHLDGTSSESGPDVETPIDGENWTTHPEGHYQGDEGGDDVANEIIPRSPNRRASEIFAFLDPVPGIYSDESFEVGTMSGKEEPDQFSARSPRIIEEDQNFHAQNQSNKKPSRQAPSFSMSLSGNSPSKRPIGPRTAATFDSKYTSSSNGKAALNVTSSADAASQSPTNIPTLSATPQEQSSPVPLTGATFASDSFASQNTTDRFLYRWIYKYLNATPSNAGQSKMITVEGSTNDAPLEASLGDDRNPFLTTDFDFDKSLPITPDSPSVSDNDSREGLDKINKRAGGFIPLPVFSPISPLSTNIVTRGVPSEADKSPTPAPRNPKNSVKENVAMWESTKPLEVEKGSVQRRSSNSNHLPSVGKSVRWSGDTSLSKRSGLGDGRGFNVPHVAGRMYGPRASPGRKPANRAMSQRAPIPSAKNTKPADLTQNYPFSQDLFPAILSPSGPAVAKTNNLLQTPQRLATHNDPSPASSSKLGAYGREIMALARSKSGARAGHDEVKPL